MAAPARSSTVPGRPRLRPGPLRPARARSGAVPAVALLGLCAALWGWSVRDRYYVTPDDGLGYRLGVAGLGAMAALLLYSARKRLRPLRGAGPLRHWFEIHMLLGVLGPLAILFHANFRVGSRNAAVALAAMALVAGSGFVGRFVYTRVHRGLFGRHESLRELSAQAASSRGALAPLLRAAPELSAAVRAFEAQALAPADGLLAGAAKAIRLAAGTRSTSRRARRALGGAGGARALEMLRAHLALVRRAAELAFYERVLGLWHAVHLPLCALLFAAAAIHVVAVHLY